MKLVLYVAHVHYKNLFSRIRLHLLVSLTCILPVVSLCLIAITLLIEQGTSKVEAIHLDHGLDPEEEGKSFDGEEFAKLRKLRFLDLGDINLHGNHEGRLLRLKWLGWHGNTLLNIPSDLHPKGLVVLDLSNSSITKEWIGWSSNKVSETALSFSFLNPFM